MSINVRFTQEDWQRVEHDWSAFWAGNLDRAMAFLTGWSKPLDQLPHAPGFTAQLPNDMPADQVVDRYQAWIEAATFHGDSFPKWWVNFGPGVMAGFLGCNVHVKPETVWFEPSAPRGAAELNLRYDADNFWWRRIKELSAVAARRWAGQVCVAHTDLGGNLDVLASFRTTEGLLTDLYDCPAEIDRLAKQVTALWLGYYDELAQVISKTGRGTSPWAPIWSPGRCYMLQSDFAYMISPKMFERFVLPDLAACCDKLDHGFYHLDGKGQLPHLDMLLSLKNLRGIQWVPGDGQPPAEEWMDVLRRIRQAGKLCQLFVSDTGALKICRELGPQGFVFQVWPKDSSEPSLRELVKQIYGAKKRA